MLGSIRLPRRWEIIGIDVMLYCQIYRFDTINATKGVSEMMSHFPHEINDLNETILCKNCTDIVVDFFLKQGYDLTLDNSIISPNNLDSEEEIPCECCGEEGENKY